MVDSIKVFTKTKEAFGWPEEPDEFTEQSAPKPTPSVVSALPNNSEMDTVTSALAYMPLTSADK
jgi:hypothetical protein